MPDIPARMTHIEIERSGGPDVLVARETGTPKPGKSEVLVKVAAAGVNRPDVLQRLGQYPIPPGASTIPGLEVAGHVVATGADVSGITVGDAVCGLTNGGGYAEYCVVPAGQVLPVPDTMDLLHAAALPETFFTVWANLFTPRKPDLGAVVLVHGGTSGIGTTTLMLCRRFGITAFATAGSDAKCEALRQLGAIAINYRSQSFREAVLKPTGERGVDIIVDIVGASYFDENLGALARDGKLILLGLMGGRVVSNVDLMSIMAKRLVITGSTLRARTDEEKARIAADLRLNVWPILAAGQCWPIIDSVFPLRQAAYAHRALEHDGHVGKIMLDPR
ncbi:NAD(P)H-quinone oxidoreductase [Mesorhizobium sp. CO1-1-8]|uniref:NAD(P)H-quinone oxidoreductase n=1 Tax=Mesorhizobium sp. CO1-1-8 TaxID=2876631 RepID=UPI001CD0736E|nr:NAD(P)H-quinone oxidoreductase [Mesorhizobium sp. CO1-1-8]MBZ9772230.1 NAD(P)H-quinone oxidoreductase [Mesorhizobium sp. CO1-1-8]